MQVCSSTAREGSVFKREEGHFSGLPILAVSPGRLSRSCRSTGCTGTSFPSSGRSRRSTCSRRSVEGRGKAVGVKERRWKGGGRSRKGSGKSGKAVEGQGKAVERQRKGSGKAVRGHGQAVEGQGKAVEGQGEAVGWLAVGWLALSRTLHTQSWSTVFQASGASYPAQAPGNIGNAGNIPTKTRRRIDQSDGWKRAGLRGPALRCVLVCSHKTFPTSSCVQPRSQENCPPSCRTLEVWNTLQCRRHGTGDRGRGCLGPRRRWGGQERLSPAPLPWLALLMPESRQAHLQNNPHTQG